MSWSDYVHIQYENLENRRKRPVLIRIPKSEIKRTISLVFPTKRFSLINGKKIREKMVMVVRPKIRSTGWIHDLSIKVKSKQSANK